jgi:hypothetical protein
VTPLDVVLVVVVGGEALDPETRTPGSQDAA